MNKIRLFMMAMVALVFAACQESNGDYRDVVYITGTMQKNTIRKGFEGADQVDLSVTCTGKVSAPLTCHVLPYSPPMPAVFVELPQSVLWHVPSSS